MNSILDNRWMQTPDNSRAVSWVFNQLLLPIPQDDLNPLKSEFTNGTAKMIFLNSFGVVLRIYNETRIKKNDDVLPLFRHRHLLRPLASFKANDFRIDIQPGAPTGTSVLDAYKAYRGLYIDGLNVMDLVDVMAEKSIDEIDAIIKALQTCNDPHSDFTGGENSLYLPYSKSNEFSYGLPVCFDPLDIEVLTESTKPISRLLHPRMYDCSPNSQQELDEQDEIYGHIREAFAKACSNDDLCPNAIKSAWALCFQEKTKVSGVLHAPWEESESHSYSSSVISATALNYENHMKNYCSWANSFFGPI